MNKMKLWFFITTLAGISSLAAQEKDKSAAKQEMIKKGNKCTNMECKCDGTYRGCKDAVKYLKKCKKDGCICNSREGRIYSDTEELWKKVINGCWNKLGDFICTEECDKGCKYIKRGYSSLMDEALAEAKKQNKLVFFIGSTGG